MGGVKHLDDADAAPARGRVAYEANLYRRRELGLHYKEVRS
jgi:hypothetical protein